MGNKLVNKWVFCAQKLFLAKNEQSSKKTASLAAKVLRQKTSTKTAKSLAASVLTQAPDKKKRKR